MQNEREKEIISPFIQRICGVTIEGAPWNPANVKI